MKSRLFGKDPDAGKDGRQTEKGAAEDERVRQCHRLEGHAPEQAPGDREGHGSLACCSQSMGLQSVDTTERPNNGLQSATYG